MVRSNWYIVTDFPTPTDLIVAKRDNLMVFTFMHRPKSIVDLASKEAFQEGWLKGLGLKPDHRLALVIIPEYLDLEQAKNEYLRILSESTAPVSFYDLTRK